MTFRRAYNLIRAAVQAGLGRVAVVMRRTPWSAAIRNVREARRHRTSAFVARAMLQRYPACYLVNGDYASLPRIELAEYRACQLDHVPLIRVSRADVDELIQGRRGYMTTFRDHGATLVEGDGEMPFATGRDIIRSIANNGWHILTVDDAHRVLHGRDIARSQYGYLATYNGWLPDVDRDADAIGIAESLFPFCDRVIASRAAAIVVYTPGLPKPLRLWRMSLRWIMPPLPPIV